jgi:hypothetical protein
VENRLKAYLVLGCNGLVSLDNFVYCKGVENPIIDLDNLSNEQYLQILEFFDNACNLFSSVVHDYNKCKNILSMLYTSYNAYDQKKLLHIQSFVKNHRECGIWLMLILKEDYKDE